MRPYPDTPKRPFLLRTPITLWDEFADVCKKEYSNPTVEITRLIKKFVSEYRKEKVNEQEATNGK